MSAVCCFGKGCRYLLTICAVYNHTCHKFPGDVVIVDILSTPQANVIHTGSATSPSCSCLPVIWAVYNRKFHENPKAKVLDTNIIASASFKMMHRMSMLVKVIRSQDGIDDKDNDKGSKSRSQSMKEQAYNKEQRERPRPHELNDKSNLIDLMKECHQ
ncbi:hypothetical protein Tco_0494581 [Tanacetum coccineum]